MFGGFFAKKENALDNFNAMCYFFRTNAYEMITDEVSDLANVLLKKITVIRTFAFINFYEKSIKKELLTEIESCQSGFKTIAKDAKIKEKFADLRLLTRKKVVKNFCHSWICQK